ncbi:NAD-dependent epimerase/dehydratase family protein [Nocardia cyriacigeorgica]|uniref:NAD-dependent epimerase/dehydratase family protein n=1 Tax=Nocardia cyriacigeorgica TaxID=135487 RepID=A0A6P1D302_9NOCA|nr:SDR family oxidoreductase [Nocardia cyriacigeorgica]NEW38967.1 NAD-dependent epimerase/dehydratase family protein [Nocardia cyriacigeorgica]NEW43899.1 NAD-dependent epimerase/dehydratase family protein [Nocardia cyriacigeorgica]NEW50306.1 NAD-dependent epimerase/dehydratase family protein [Nocardia cyriacigeorgica]
MTYLVTGATGFIGRFLIPELLKRADDIHVVVRPGPNSAARFEYCAREWSADDRVRPVPGDLGAPCLGIDPMWLAEHRGRIDHIFHLAVGFDEQRYRTEDGHPPDVLGRQAANGTANVVELAADLRASTLHHLSTVEVAGRFEGLFAEDMFDIGQAPATPAQRAAVEAERIVRESELNWRIYRPSIVVGHSVTGVNDRVDGPYYFFRLLRMAAQLPRLLPVLVPKLGETNMVPVDFVAKALAHLAHLPGPGGQTYHLVDPRRRGAVAALNLFADEAGAPHLVEIMPKRTLDMMLRLPGAERVLPRVGVPLDILEHSEFSCWFDCRHATAALAGSGISVPPLEAYAPVLWRYWIENWV